MQIQVGGWQLELWQWEEVEEEMQEVDTTVMQNSDDRNVLNMALGSRFDTDTAVYTGGKRATRHQQQDCDMQRERERQTDRKKLNSTSVYGSTTINVTDSHYLCALGKRNFVVGFPLLCFVTN